MSSFPSGRGAFREQPVYVVRRLADGTQQVRFEAPPSEAVAKLNALPATFRR